MKNREDYLDQLRALAIISIICCHVTAEIITRNPDLMAHFKTFYAVVLLNSGRYVGVPLFVMISGALLINKDYSLKTFVKKRFNRVFVPFIFWVIIFILFAVAIQNRPLTFDLVINVFLGVKGSIESVLWFIWMLMIVYVAIFIINKILEYAQSKSDGLERKCIDVLVIASLICFLIFNVFDIPYSMISRYCMFIPYAILGYYLTHTQFTEINANITAKRIVSASFILAIVCYLCFVMSICTKSIALNKFYSEPYFNILLVIINCCIILLFRYLPESDGVISRKVNGFLTSGHISKAILSISLCSYGMYFVNILVIRYLERAYLLSIEYYTHPIFWIPILLVVVFASSWALVWAMGKIPYVDRFSGVTKIS